MYLQNFQSPSDVANWVRQQNIPTVPTLGFLSGRPNQAIEHGDYNVIPLNPMVHSSRMSGLGQNITVNMELLIGGVALLALGLYLLGGKKAPKRRERRARRYRRKLAELGA